jgi:hypothetical protein
VPAAEGWLQNFLYVMGAITSLVLIYCAARARVTAERVFISLWLFSWATLWVKHLFSPSLLTSLRYAHILTWTVAFLIALRIALYHRNEKLDESRRQSR